MIRHHTYIQDCFEVAPKLGATLELYVPKDNELQSMKTFTDNNSLKIQSSPESR